MVTKDIEPYTIVGGNPATLIRKRFGDKTIDALLKLNWWDWDFDKITKHAKEIVTGDVSLFAFS